LAPVAKAILWTCGVFMVLGMLESKAWLVVVAGVAALAGFSWVTFKSGSAIQELSQMIRDVATRLKLLPINGTHKRV
jgi:hypothetical protein